MIEGWTEYKIEDFGEISTGTTPSTKRTEYYGGSYKLISPVDLDNGKYITTAHKFITEDGLKVSRTLPRNSILIGCIGNIGKIGMTNDEISAFNQQINAIVCNENFIPDFIYYLLIHNKPILEKSAVKTTLPILNKGNFQKIKLNAPNLHEQHKIIYVLSTIQTSIEQQDKLIQTTTELKKALMQKLFTKGTKGEKQKQIEIGLVPESWEVARLGDYLEKTKIEDPSKKPNIEFIYVDVSSVNNESFKITNANKIHGKDAPSRARKLIQKDDVIFATVRPTLKRIAKITDEFNNQICSTGYCVLKPVKTQLDTEFLYQYLQLDEFISRIEKLQRGASYPAVRDSDVKGMRIPLPKYEEQVIIGNSLRALDQKISNMFLKKQSLTDLFKTLLHELMTGQRRVHEIDFFGNCKRKN